MTQKFRSRLYLHTVNASGQPAKQMLALAADVCVREILNGDYFVTFTYPKLVTDVPGRYEAITERAEISFPTDLSDGVAGQHFVIKRVDEVRHGIRVYKQVEAHHVAFDLNRYYLDDYVEFSATQPPSYLLGMLGNGTPYTFAVEGSFNNQDVFEWGEQRKYTLLSEVAALYGGEVMFNNTEITLTTRKGANRGAEIRYRKNLSGITRKSHDMERITRLYGYGKNGLTIEGYGGRTAKYIDSPYLDPQHIYEDSVSFPDIDDQARLLDAMERHLRTVELPKVSYEVDYEQLEKAESDFPIVAIREVGDTVTVIDESLGYRFDARVTEYERFPFSANKARIVLANFRELTAADAIFQATVASRRAIVYTTENAVLKGVKYDDSITLVDGLGMAVSDDANRLRVRLGQVGPGDYGFAAYNKAGAKTLWFDAATGDGRFAGTLVAAGGQFSGEITGGTITIGSGNNVFKAGTSGISLGHATFGSAPFRVTAAGALTATNAHISGTIHAAAGTIGGWTINAGSLTGPGSIIGGSITGSTVQTKAAGNYPRIGLSSTDNLLTAETNASNKLTIHSQFGGHPAIRFNDSNGGFMDLNQNGNTFNMSGGGNVFISTSTGRVDINSPGGVYANGVRLDV